MFDLINKAGGHAFFFIISRDVEASGKYKVFKKLQYASGLVKVRFLTFEVGGYG